MEYVQRLIMSLVSLDTFAQLSILCKALCVVGICLSVKTPVVRAIALIYFIPQIVFWVISGPASDYAQYYFVMCAAVDAIITLKLFGINHPLSSYLRVTSVLSLSINLTVFAAYYIPLVKFAYYVYRPPLAIIEISQALSLIVFSGPIMNRLAAYAANRRRKEVAYEWLARLGNIVKVVFGYIDGRIYVWRHNSQSEVRDSAAQRWARENESPH